MVEKGTLEGLFFVLGGLLMVWKMPGNLKKQNIKSNVNRFTDLRV